MPEPGATVAELLQAAATRLRAAGIADSRREARRIWADLMEGRSGAVLDDRGTGVSAEDAAAFTAAVARRATGEPLAHVTGLVGFRRLTLRSDRRALIPRPETEGLVELVLARAPSGRVADVGTGSGCIALSLADEGQYDLVIGVDRSREALTLAAENRARTGLAIELTQGDMVTAVAEGSLDAIISNPPYLTEREHAGLDQSVRAWEPATALASGTDGLQATSRLIVMAAGAVRAGGWLALEVDVERAGVVAGLATASGWRETAVHMDLFGRARYVVARRNEAE